MKFVHINVDVWNEIDNTVRQYSVGESNCTQKPCLNFVDYTNGLSSKSPVVTTEPILSCLEVNTSVLPQVLGHIVPMCSHRTNPPWYLDPAPGEPVELDWSWSA